MKKEKVIRYDKAVRDKIPCIIEATGKEAIVEVVDSNCFTEYLVAKLDEELAEYKASQNIEELADLIEVVYGILDCQGISMETFETIRKEKALKRGTFSGRIVLKEVRE